MRNLKIDVKQENKVPPPLNAENKRDVTNDVLFAYVHEKINILLSVLSMFSVFFNDFNLNTQGVVYLELAPPPPPTPP